MFSVRQSLFVAVNSNIGEDSPLFPRLAQQFQANWIKQWRLAEREIQTALKQAISPPISQNIQK